MKTRQISITEGPLALNIFIFSVPLVFTYLLQILFNIVDVSVCGQFAGSYALGAVGSTTQLLFFFTGLLTGLGGAINVLVAFYLGAKNQKDVDTIVHTAFLICLFTGLFLLFLGFFAAKPVLTLIKTKPELISGAILYVRIFMLSMPATALFNFGNAVLNAQGNTRLPLLYLALSGVLNIFLDLLFVIIFHMSVAGVAIASVIAQYLSCFLVLLRLFKGYLNVRLSFSKLHIDSVKASQILKLGIPAGLQNCIFATANVFIQSGINYFDAATVAGTTAASNGDNIIYNVMAAFYTACATFIGQNFGAKNKKRILQSYFTCGLYALLAGTIGGILLRLFGNQFMSFFSKDPVVIQAGIKKLSIMSFSYFAASLMDNTIAANRGLGKTFVPSIIVIIGSCFFRILWLYTVFARFHTIGSLFLLYVFSWLFTAFIEIIYFFSVYKKQTKNL